MKGREIGGRREEAQNVGAEGKDMVVARVPCGNGGERIEDSGRMGGRKGDRGRRKGLQRCEMRNKMAL